MAQYGRVYRDAAEKERRFQIFKDNYEYVDSVNKAGKINVPIAKCSGPCFVLTFMVLGIWVFGATAHAIGDVRISKRYEQWMAQYGRVYRDAAEKERRFQIFKGNYKCIESVNKAGNRKHKLGLNQFADMTCEE
ncbi:ananain-like [Elaeis guineensis]|uniref:ananain-like n=1 Tax=Elaeis guineensis var. tenera TaxID=51953 RepID=UPI003C6CC915